MDVQIKGKELFIKYKFKKGETYKINVGKKFKTISVYKKPIIVNGIASTCEDGKEILFIDFDKILKDIINRDYLNIQRKFKLPPGYLFSTKKEIEDGEEIGNFHVICLKKFSSKKIFNIISSTHCDVNYASMPLRNKYKNWVLRISNKGKKSNPKFEKIIGENINLNKEISKPHLDFLNKIYDLPKINYINFDNCKKIYLQRYETLNL